MNILDIRNECFFNNYESVKRKLSDISIIAVHHSAREYHIGEDYKHVIIQAATYHKNKIWGYLNSKPIYGNGLMYHYVITPDGQIYKTRNMEEVTWHANNANNKSVAIMLQGNFEIQNPTIEQLKSLEELLQKLLIDLSLDKSSVFAHGELINYGNQTACCGRMLKDDVVRFRNTGFIFDQKYIADENFKESFGYWLSKGVFSKYTDPRRQPTNQEIGEFLYRYDKLRSS
jgi:N-acetyl-anhydromuramyl-L-alanine amidase AmpD